jgi:hypothetical protein
MSHPESEHERVDLENKNTEEILTNINDEVTQRTVPKWLELYNLV